MRYAVLREGTYLDPRVAGSARDGTFSASGQEWVRWVVEISSPDDWDAVLGRLPGMVPCYSELSYPDTSGLAVSGIFDGVDGLATLSPRPY